MDGRGRYLWERPRLWRAYELAWSLVAGSLLAAGLVAAAITLPAGAMLGLMLAVGIPVGASVSAWSLVTLLPRWAGLYTAVWAGLVMNAASGLVTLAGMWTLVGFVVVAATIPEIVELVGSRLLGRSRRTPRRRRVRRARSDPSSRATEGLVAQDLQFDDPHACRLLDPGCPSAKRPAADELTTADLGRLWKVSGKWLDLGLSGNEMAHLAQLRSTCLDELERRDPGGFSDWVVGERPWLVEPTRFIDRDEETLPPEAS